MCRVQRRDDEHDFARPMIAKLPLACFILASGSRDEPIVNF